MERSALTKLSIAFAVLCAVICVISIAPLAVAFVFAIIAFICLLLCVLILIIGGFVWLFTIGQVSIFDFGFMLSDFGLGLFNFVGPVADFSFHYLTPIAGGIALFLGILGIIISSVGISKAEKQNAEEKALKSLSEVSALPQEINSTPEDTSGKKKKRKRKKKTNKGLCIASLAVSVVFSAVAIIALIAAVIAVTMFYVPNEAFLPIFSL